MTKRILPEVLDFVAFLKTKSKGKKSKQSLYGMFADTGGTLDKIIAPPKPPP